jgi:hypothetical protein
VVDSKQRTVTLVQRVRRLLRLTPQVSEFQLGNFPEFELSESNNPSQLSFILALYPYVIFPPNPKDLEIRRQTLTWADSMLS